jgi:hypothetical protein
MSAYVVDAHGQRDVMHHSVIQQACDPLPADGEAP